MDSLTAKEQALTQHIGRRLATGERSELLALAGEHFTLGFEFGKDWVRLRSVKRRSRPGQEATASSPEKLLPGAPWVPCKQEPNTFQLPNNPQWRLRFDAAVGRWQVSEGQQVLVAAPTAQAITKRFVNWLRDELAGIADQITWVQFEQEAALLEAPEAGAPQQQAKLRQLSEIRSSLTALIEQLGSRAAANEAADRSQ